jgi:hypothetical protein
MPIIVRINRQGKVYNQDYRVRVKKSLNEDVLWIDVENGGPWTIEFGAKSSSAPTTYTLASGSPFSQPSYTVDNGASKGSTGGPVNGTVQRTYRYNVRNAAGEVTDDPDVDVE